MNDTVNLVGDYVIDHPRSTKTQIETAVQCSRGQLEYAIWKLRNDVFGDDDTINLICEPDPDKPRGEWLYRLVGRIEDARWYLANRLGELETRVVTQQKIAGSLRRGVDERTTEGRRAKVLHRGLTRIVEDLGDLQ